jgi:hypothetical protein
VDVLAKDLDGQLILIEVQYTRELDYLYRGTTAFEGIHTHDTFALTEQQREFFGIDRIADVFPQHYLIRLGRPRGNPVDAGRVGILPEVRQDRGRLSRAEHRQGGTNRRAT